MKCLNILLAACFCLSASLPAADKVLITEFMADNNRSLLDENGDSSDWIELFNAGSNSVNLLGWHLTDDANDLTLWTFPAVTLAPGRFLLVFASGKNRAVAGAPLHTSFQLDAAGEYLALVRPDLSVAQEFAPAYPPQAEDVSYGVVLNLNTIPFITNGLIARWRVPRSAADFPPDWAETNYLDSSWPAGPVGIGYDAGGVISSGPSTNIAPGRLTTQSSTLSGFPPDLAVNGSLADFTHTAAGQNLPATWEVNLGATYGIESIVLHNRTSCCGSRLRDITVRILNAFGTTTNYTSPLLNPENLLGAYPNGPANLTIYLTNQPGGMILGGRVRITRTPDPDLSGSAGQGNTDEADVLSLGEVQVFARSSSPSFDSLIRTDLENVMFHSNATALVRVPFQFNLEESFEPEQLSLAISYDDGFIAYLNGVEVARRNAPASPSWNAAATTEQADQQALQREPIDLSAFLGLLREGDNVLAIHGLNLNADDDDFVILPELTGQSGRGREERYFPQATPGANNTTAYLGLVGDTHFNPDRGFYETNIAVTIACDTPGVTIRYTTNGAPPTETTGFIYAGPIPISRTTILRAAAFRTGWRPSNADTHSYFYVRDVGAQTVPFTTNAGFPATWGGTAPDYGMDPDVVGPGDRYNGKYAASLTNDLRAVPTLSIAMLTADLFGPDGIYTRSTLRGLAYERPASFELIFPDGTEGFQLNCGMRLQGGAFRDHGLTKKHSFHPVFKNLYGPGKLNYPLFGTYSNATDSFDDLVLRANSNDGWQWSSAGARPIYVRDSFGRETILAMGGVASHEVFTHVYLNGIYWGLYNTVERPDAAFASTYFGGEKDNWDSQNSGVPSNGDLFAWNMLLNMCNAGLSSDPAYERIQGNNPDGTRNPAFTNLLDVPNMIDYMIVNLYVGNTDWPGKNFWVARDRTTNSTGFKFLMWDSEWSMGIQSDLTTDRTGVSGNVAAPYAACRANAEFRVRFGDHLHRHFFNGGPLYVDPQNSQWDPARPERNLPAARFAHLCDEIDRAIVGESARWGDQHVTFPPYTRDEHWLVERTNLLRNYFPQRSAIVLNQFRTAGLYPTLAAPSFNLPGGLVPPGFQLLITDPNPSPGTIFYAFNGADPRLRGGAVNPAAQAYSAPVIINAPTQVKARVRSGLNWSALMESTYYPPQDFTKLQLTEIMYHPPAFGTNDGDEVEFLELKNTGANTLQLGGLNFGGGLSFSFTNGTVLAPGAFFVLVRNPSLFQAKYPGVTFQGIYSGRLANEGETLRLVHPLGGTALAVTYRDSLPWPQTADGLGFSLVPVNSSLNPAPDEPSSWRASSTRGGSPGTEDPAPNIAPILINEILAATDLPPGDQIELFNPTTAAVDISGWFLTDRASVPMKFRIPNGTILGPGGYVVFDERNFNPTPGTNNSFALRADGDEVHLFSGDASTNLTGYSHSVSFGVSPTGVSFGRHVISTGEEQFPLQIGSSLGAPNLGPGIGPVVINEIHYHPELGDDEFIELKNITANPVPLFDPFHPTNTWRLAGLNYTFPEGTLLPANGLLLLVPGNPVSFRARYGVVPEVPILGPYAGLLQDSGERLELKRPDIPGTNEVDFITVDEVRYNDRSPWPSAADGGGASLQRKAPGLYGNDPSHWEAATPTPGIIFVPGTPPSLTLEPVSQSAVAYQDVAFTAAASGPGPLRFQWRHNGSILPLATNASLQLRNVQPSQAGSYSIVVFNSAGSTTSSNATLTVLLPATILQQPQSVSMRASTNAVDYGSTTNRTATFTVVATSTTAISYQWRFNGLPISPLLNPTATSSVLVVPNVSLVNEGVYDVVLTDGVGPILSGPATLSLLLSPMAVVAPIAQSVVAGGDLTVGVSILGGPPPFMYQWRRISTLLTVNVTNERTNFFTIANIQTNQGGLYRLVVTNAANPTPGLVVPFTLTVLADSDGDGLPDDWENSYGFNPTNAVDRTADQDGDGMRNWEEYIAGTDPTDVLSYLKVNRLTTSASLVTLEFQAVSNRTYTIEYADNADGSWSRLADVLARTNNRVELLTDPIATSSRIYRLRTPRRP